jgi:hypothetical protein
MRRYDSLEFAVRCLTQEVRSGFVYIGQCMRPTYISDTSAETGQLASGNESAYKTFLSRKAYNSKKKSNKNSENNPTNTYSERQHPQLQTFPKQRYELNSSPEKQQQKRQPSIKIFVGGLHQSTRKEQVIELIQNSLGIAVSCFQLRIRFPAYTSFCVMAEEEYADVILCSNIWPKQAKVMHFRGRQNQNQKSGNSAAERQNTKKITTNSVVASKTQTTMDRFLTQKQAPTQVPTYANVTVRNKRKQLTSVADEIENYDD